MRNVTIDNVTDAVIASIGQNGEVSARQREIMTGLLTHLHGFCKDVKLQHHEFIRGGWGELNRWDEWIFRAMAA
jgi:catechol 1,2-dioxygenase